MSDREHKPTEPFLDQSISDGISARSSTLASSKIKIGAALFLVMGGLAMLIYLMFNGSTVELKSVAATAEAPPSDGGLQLGMRGKLLPGSFVREADGITANFAMIDEEGDTAIDVVYSGELPSTLFNEHSQIIVQGFKDQNGIFHAEILQVKCPSKYQTVEEQSGEVSPY